MPIFSPCITQEALAKYTARQIRFAFLTHHWNSTLDFSCVVVVVVIVVVDDDDDIVVVAVVAVFTIANRIFSGETMSHAIQTEKFFAEFFLNVKVT